MKKSGPVKTVPTGPAPTPMMSVFEFSGVASTKSLPGHRLGRVESKKARDFCHTPF